MKVIAFNGSPHKNRVINKGLETMCKVLNNEGVETEIVHVGGAVQGCIDCRKCKDLGKCVFDNDIVNSAVEKMNRAEGIIIGTPVYYGSIAGNFKSFLDRFFFSGAELTGKAAAALVSCSSATRSGGLSAFNQLNNYFNVAQAVIVPSFFWGIVYGRNEQELIGDEEGLYIIENTARNMAWLMNALYLGEKNKPFPLKTQEARSKFKH
jgi:multimeric flavodoxin WrbA